MRLAGGSSFLFLEIEFWLHSVGLERPLCWIVEKPLIVFARILLNGQGQGCGVRQRSGPRCDCDGGGSGWRGFGICRCGLCASATAYQECNEQGGDCASADCNALEECLAVSDQRNQSEQSDGEQRSGGEGSGLVRVTLPCRPAASSSEGSIALMPAIR